MAKCDTKKKGNSGTMMSLLGLFMMLVVGGTCFWPLFPQVASSQEATLSSPGEKLLDSPVLHFDVDLKRIDLNPNLYNRILLTADSEKQDFIGIASGHYDRPEGRDRVFPADEGKARRWFRVLIQNGTGVDQKVILANALPMGSLYVLEGHSPEKLKVAGNFHILAQDPFSISAAVKLTLKPGLNRVYLGANTRGNINFFMMSLWNSAAFEGFEKERVTFLAICFGAFIALWVYNLILYLLMRQKVYFYYMLFCTGLIMVEGILGGAYLIFGTKHYGYIQQYWPAAITLTLVGFSLFATEFTDATLDETKPWAYSINISLGFAIASTFGYYFGISIFANLLLFFTIATILLMTFSIYRILVSSIEVYYLLVSCIPLIVSSIMLILQISLIMDFNYRIIWFQLGSALLHVILVSTALGTKANSDRTEKIRLQSSIDLGRMVQELLLPKRMKDRLAAFDYAFCYVPREGSLSGDWINHWSTRDGTMHFVLGSVLGEKIQAALAVASIATVIERARDLDLSLEDCLTDINDTLLHLFSGRIGTKASGVSVSSDGFIQFWNFGGPGWNIIRSGNEEVILKNEEILGKSSHKSVEGIRYSLADISVSYVFSDCFAPDQEQLVNFRRQISQSTTHEISSDALCKIALDISATQRKGDSNVQADDRTMLVISSKKSAENQARSPIGGVVIATAL
jgi:hypothetical protein